MESDALVIQGHLQSEIDKKINFPVIGTTGQFLQKTSNSTQWTDVDFSNYYTKSQTEQLLEDLSNSFDGKLESYYTKGEADVLLQEKYDLSDAQVLNTSITALEGCKVHTEILSNPQNNICTIQGIAAVFAVIDNNNHYWPVQL